MLYHYTDFIALDGIIGNAELRLNNVLNMNDASEMRFYMEGICGAVCSRLRANGLARRAEEAQSFFEGEMKDEFRYSTYAACFSRYRDDASQWERYAGHGHGVCLVFDESMLNKLADSTNGVISMQKVYYSLDFSEHELSQKFYTLLAGQSAPADCMAQLQTLIKEAWITSAAFKHPSFANENEVRMVVTPCGSPSFPVLPRYHVSFGRIKKYYPLHLERLCRLSGIDMEELVREIIIGPISTQSPAILKDYLSDKGYRQLSERVSISECPLRQPTS